MITSSRADHYTVQILSTEGQLVADKEIEGKEREIDITGMPAGIYIIRIYTGLEVINKKIMLLKK